MFEEFQKVVMPYHLDAVKQVAGRVALRFHDQMEKRVAQISDERRRLSEAMTQLGVEVWPSQANFILFGTSPCDLSGDEVWKRLLDRSVLVRNCSSWPELKNCLRVTLGTEQENTIFLQALQEALQ